MTNKQTYGNTQYGITGLFILFVLCLTYIFRDAGQAIWNSWGQEEYSHGYLIPPLAVLLLLNKMDDTKIIPRPSWYGFGIVCLGLVTSFIFQMTGIVNALPQIYVLSLIGLVLLFLGPQAIRPLAGALILLLFAAPLPKFFYYTLSSQMQAISTSLGVALLGLVSIPVFQDGNIIDLGGYKLNVVEACSGVRYLFPMLSLSFLLAYLFQAPLWKRVFLFLSAPPISIMLNGLRIALVGITVDQWGSAMAEGLIHDLEGLVIFVAGIALLVLEIKLLQTADRYSFLNLDALHIPSFKNRPQLVNGKPVKAVAVIFVFATILSTAMPFLTSQILTSVPLPHSFNQFPLQLNNWVGQTQTLAPQALKVLGTDNYLLADYAQDGQPPVNLYVLYFSKQDSSSNEAVHSPTVCIPAGGWSVSEKTQKILTLADPASSQSLPLAVNRLIISKDATRQIVYFWYAQQNHSTTKPLESRLYTLVNSLTRGHSNGALIRVVTSIDPHENEADAEKRLGAFLQDNLTTLHSYMFETP